MFMDTMLFFSVIILLTVSITIILCFSVKCRRENNLKFDNGITGIYILSETCCDPEIVLRDLVSYIQRNNIRCFRKIYIKCRSDDTETLNICRRICSDYPVIELLEKEEAE